MNLFGNKNALIGSIELLIMGLYVLGAMIFRKSVANDMMNVGFSVIGASGLSCIAFVTFHAIFTEWAIKFPVAIGLVGWIIGGLVFSEIIGDGWAGGKDE